MPNTREKLIELIHDSGNHCSKTDCVKCEFFTKLAYCKANVIADHLIANGVTFQNRDIHWATEQAYKNGYADGAKKLAERLKEIYNHPRYDRPNAHTLIGKLFWNIDDIVKEMVGADNACD